jgi:hypothetical protein
MQSTAKAMKVSESAFWRMSPKRKLLLELSYKNKEIDIFDVNVSTEPKWRKTDTCRRCQAFNGAPHELEFGTKDDHVVFTVPSLKYWTMAVIEQ